MNSTGAVPGTTTGEGIELVERTLTRIEPSALRRKIVCCAGGALPVLYRVRGNPIPRPALHQENAVQEIAPEAPSSNIATRLVDLIVSTP